ncbi:hypothetical protein Q9L42_018245 [Methylomarinum sp. Ch1-1]|uniref:Lipoprotein n=1 Tax=Methylomarinum roseum TaxID=3067653 RepID=A0AAU7NTI1_9GAMM|nr:hypothetical protein [Methylomarinum sp. Ch1-1]MDP4519691.1 hypothetical protein [Methylomarinum sp. Ch1-1]
MLKINGFLMLLMVTALSCSRVAEADPHYRGGRYLGHRHSHPRFSFYLGTPYPRPYYPYYPYYYPYYPPAIVTVPSEPPVYIERQTPQSSQQLPAGYWYYCTDPEGYYPYVKECSSGWRQVDPAPPSSK